MSSFSSPDYLSSAVRYDSPRLPPLFDRRVVHLQCHIGTDTVSLARLGASTVVGIDFSPSAIAVAEKLAAQAQTRNAHFAVADAYDARAATDGRAFDLAYTGIGSLCWLPDIELWARTVAGLLRGGGELFVREMHPILWTMNARDDDLLVVANSYFEGQPVLSSAVRSYCGRGVVPSPDRVLFNHGIGEIFTALTNSGFRITLFEEHREVPWQALGSAMAPSKEFDGEYVLSHDGDRLPLTYTLRAQLVV